MAVVAAVVISGLVALGMVRSGPSSDRPGDRVSATRPSGNSTARPPVVDGGGPGLDHGDDGASRSGIDRSGEADVSDRTIQAGIIQREYLVATPSWATQDMELPLVVALHGLTADRWAILAGADWKGEVQERGFVAVFPQGLANSWNSGSCCPPSSLTGTDDVGFIDSVIAAVESSEPVDRRRVFVTGFSNGGLMTYRYGCARAEDLVAIAPMGGSNLERCVPRVPLSLFHQHSDPDPVVPYDGGFGVGQLLATSPLPPVPDSVQKWAEESACGAGTTGSDLTPTVTVKRWDSCPDGVRVELVRLAGHGHEWPSVKGYDGLAAMLDFFGIS